MGTPKFKEEFQQEEELAIGDPFASADHCRRLSGLENYNSENAGLETANNKFITHESRSSRSASPIRFLDFRVKHKCNPMPYNTYNSKQL